MITAVMPQEQTPSPSPAAPATRMRAWWHEVSTPARFAFVCGVPLACGLAAWEAVAGDALGPEHPLAFPRLALRLGSAPAYCTRCGTELEKGARYCDRCGARVAS